jgi:hypothetical protein
MKEPPDLAVIVAEKPFNQQGGLAPVPDPRDSFRLIEAFEV